MSTATEWPRAEVLLSAEGHAHVIFEGVEADLSKPTPKEARAAVVTHLSHRARTLGHPISTTITEPAGSWRIAVYPDGTIITEGALTPAPAPTQTTAQTRTRPSVAARSAPPAPARRRQRAAPAPEADTPETTGIRLPPGLLPRTASTAGRTAPRRHRAAPAPALPAMSAPSPAAPAAPPSPSTAPRSRSAASAVRPVVPPSPARPVVSPLPASPARSAPSPLPGTARSAPSPAPPETLATPYSPSAVPRPHSDTQPETSAVPPETLATPYSASEASAAQPPMSATPSSPSGAPPDPRERARSTSLLTEVTNEAPAATGLRGALNQLGLHLGPAARERAERADAAAVAQHWAGPRTIAVVNGKGGATKTPTAILLSAVFARYGGAGVIAFDNNSTRGTLGWRTQQGPHDSTVIDLLPHVDHLLSPQAQAAEISGFVHHQREDRYDVLRSRPEVLADAKPGDADTFDAVHAVLTKYYRLVVVDSGNDESSPQWRAMIARADAIVVPTTTRPDHAESARLLLAELAGADDHAARLAESALVVVSQGSKAEPSPAHLVSTFQGIARAAVGIPYDPAMAGRPLIFDSLALATRRAWLRAGTALAAGLT